MRRFAIGAAAAVVLLLAALIMITREESGRDRVKISQNGDFFSYAPLYVAIDGKFFERNRIDVTLVNAGGDEKSWSAVLTGDVDFGVGDPAFVALSSERGQTGRVVGSMINGVPFWGVTYRTDIAPFTKSSDLNGFVVATFPSPSTAYALQKRMFESSGLPAKIREGGFGSLLTILKARQADIALELEPNVTQAVADGGRVVYSLSQVYGPFAITGIQVTDRTLRERRDLVRRALCGWQLALDSMHGNPSLALQLLSARFPEIRREVAEAALSRMLTDGTIPKLITITNEAWEKVIELRISLGDLKTNRGMDAYVENELGKSVIADPSCRL